MIQTVYFEDFLDAFKSFERENAFSWEGKKALFDYLEEYEESTGEKIELDIIALCTEWTEYENMEEFHKNYNTEAKTPEAIEDETTVIRIPDSESFIIADF